MSTVNEITYIDDDAKLDHLLENVKLIEPDSDQDDGGNDMSNVHGSQVPLFATVQSPTDLPRSETSLPPGEGSGGKRQNGGGPCQRPALLPTTLSPVLTEVGMEGSFVK